MLSTIRFQLALILILLVGNVQNQCNCVVVLVLISGNFCHSVLQLALIWQSDFRYSLLCWNLLILYLTAALTYLLLGAILHLLLVELLALSFLQFILPTTTSICIILIGLVCILHRLMCAVRSTAAKKMGCFIIELLVLTLVLHLQILKSLLLSFVEYLCIPLYQAIYFPVLIVISRWLYFSS